MPSFANQKVSVKVKREREKERDASKAARKVWVASKKHM